MTIYENPFEFEKLTEFDFTLHFDSRDKCIWKRTEIPEYTMQEAIEKMGHEFKLKK